MSLVQEPAAPANDSHRARRRRRIGAVVAWAAFALTPWVTFGLGTPVAFMIAAGVLGRRGRARAVVLWTSAAVYAAAVIAELAEVSAPPGTAGYNIFGVSVLIAIVGGLQALALTLVAIGRHRSARSRSSPQDTTAGDLAPRTVADTIPPSRVPGLLARLQAAGELTDLLEAAWDAFSLLLDTCQDRPAELFAAFMFAPAAAAGLRAVESAPSRPAGLSDGTGQDACVMADMNTAAEVLASLAQALCDRLAAAAARARDPGDRQACRDAAAQAAEIRDLLARQG